MPTLGLKSINNSTNCAKSELKLFFRKTAEEKRKKFRMDVREFYSSVKSRMLVAEVIKRIRFDLLSWVMWIFLYWGYDSFCFRAGGRFTFDYIALIILASIISFFGLIEDSSVTLVSFLAGEFFFNGKLSWLGCLYVGFTADGSNSLWYIWRGYQR